MNTKISTIVEEKTWSEFKALASQNHQSLSGLLTEAM